MDFTFQAENDAVGQELQKQLEAAGLSKKFSVYLEFSNILNVNS